MQTRDVRSSAKFVSSAGSRAHSLTEEHTMASITPNDSHLRWNFSFTMKTNCPSPTDSRGSHPRSRGLVRSHLAGPQGYNHWDAISVPTIEIQGREADYAVSKFLQALRFL